MINTSPVVIMAGFSLTNRILLYVSLATLLAAFLGGVEGNLPISVGFLGFTICQQYLFYIATKNKKQTTPRPVPLPASLEHALPIHLPPWCHSGKLLCFWTHVRGYHWGTYTQRRHDVGINQNELTRGVWHISVLVIWVENTYAWLV